MAELEDPAEEEFCVRFVAHHNCKRAAKETGMAEAWGYYTRHKPQVDARIRELLSEKFKALHMETDEVLGQLARIARADIRDLYDESGVLKPPSEWDENVVAAVTSVEVDELFEGTGKDRKQIGVTRKLKVTPRLDALNTLAKHHKLIGGETTLNVFGSLADRMEQAAQQTKPKTDEDLIG